MHKVMTRTAQRRPGSRPPARQDSRRPAGAPPRAPGGSPERTAPGDGRPPRSRATGTGPGDSRPPTAPSTAGTATRTTAGTAPGTRATAATGTGATPDALPTPARPVPGAVSPTVPAQARRLPPPQPRPTDVFADLLLAVLSGQRPVHSMLRHTAGRAYDELARLAERGPLRARGTRPVVRDIGYYEARPGAVEVFARIGAGDQLRAMAFRLERGRDLRWRCTAVELGGARPPRPADDA
ncbi:Rv3235 family protein [Streptomyces sp. NPDC059690]|uniref:Rv3235 family protein n=1 Tax=Streptomyces sp. NPDC059690 TaxID=3346907 RepID=UPI0036B3ABA0